MYVLMKLHPAPLAQSVEHGTLNPRVVGSNPTLGELTFCANILRAVGFSQGPQETKSNLSLKCMKNNLLDMVKYLSCLTDHDKMVNTCTYIGICMLNTHVHA